jgi:nucleoid-associated protein YgaU
MTHRLLRPLALTGALLLVSGCATPPAADSAESSAPAAKDDRPESAESRRESPREAATATEKAAAERTSSTPAGGSSSDMAKLVEQLNEAARELATLRTANAKLRAARPTSAPDAPAAKAEPAAPKADPTDERLAASLKSYQAFKQEMSALLAEAERTRKGSATLSADLKAATEQVRQAKAALARVEEDLRVEKRLRLEAETNAGQLRDQLRTIARAMADAGLSADKLKSSADSGGSRPTARPPSRYVVREGDTLMKIADRLYGDAGKWRLILEANRGRIGSDGAVEAGTELQIPRN